MAEAYNPIFPVNTKFTYLDEGAANIVYRIFVPLSTPPPSVFEDYEDGDPLPLLRARKNLPTTVPCEISHDAWTRLFEPMFGPHYVVQQSLVELRPGNVIERLNKELEEWEQNKSPTKGSLSLKDIRPVKRQGVYLADDEHGLLIQDMSPHTANEVIIEFKPKWLIQSPTAPKNSRRCRQCARIARRNAQRTQAGRDLYITPCPLDFTSSSYDDLYRAANMILIPAKSNGWMPPSSSLTVHRLAGWLRTNTLIPRLKHYQQLFDKRGPLKGEEPDEHFLVAMTLRDCTVFLRFPLDDSQPCTEMEARLGDMDLKSKDKQGYWYEMEKQLIDDGWYTEGEANHLRQPNNCQLNPNRDISSNA
ncbi:inositol-pentakisphosphate 2-kinase [Bisporella sp. PMI_857]|nr:inositol-pentakisphosphate 2-kinase [Bisporella sp. PMI_857]